MYAEDCKMKLLEPNHTAKFVAFDNGKANAIKNKKIVGGRVSYNIQVSFRFMVYIFITSIVMAFTCGRLCRWVVVSLSEKAAVDEQDKLLGVDLHRPLIAPSKPFPKSVYTSKVFDFVAGKASRCFSLMTSLPYDPSFDVNDPSMDKDSYHEIEEGLGLRSLSPSRQHLFVDMVNVDKLFLQDGERLARALLKLVEVSDLPSLLSYHCYIPKSAGLSCIGIMLDNHHVALHSMPHSGVLLLDLLVVSDASNENKSLLPVIPKIKKLFGISKRTTFSSGENAEATVPQTLMHWSKKNRGIRLDEEENSEHNRLLDYVESSTKLNDCTDKVQRKVEINTTSKLSKIPSMEINEAKAPANLQFFGSQC